MEKIYDSLKKKIKISIEFHENIQDNIKEINGKLDGKCPGLIYIEEMVDYIKLDKNL